MSGSSSTSPDPIILPSSPPSAHSHRRHGYDGAKSISTSPLKRRVDAASGPRQVSAQDDEDELSPRATRRLERQQRRDLRRKEQPEGSSAYITTESARKRRRLDRVQRQEQRRAANDQPTEDRVQSRSESVQYNALDFQEHQVDEEHGRYGNALLENIDPQLRHTEQVNRHSSQSAASLLSHDGNSEGSVDVHPPGAFVADDPGETTVANEDFTMITGPSLASIKANNSVLVQDDSELRNALRGGKQHIAYPDVGLLTPRAVRATVEVQRSITQQTRSIRKDYDAMSWQPTVQIHSTKERVSTEQTRESQVPSSGRKDSTTSAGTGAQAKSSAATQNVDDIWAEEASRSLQEDAQRSHEKAHGSQFIPPIFSDEPQPPRRSKIPSTWRKTSGVDLSYADSPESVRGGLRAVRDRTATPRREPARQSARVMTPPSTDGGEDDEDGLDATEDEDDGPVDDDEHDETDMLGDDLELTNPDAAATQLQGVNDDGDHTGTYFLMPPIRPKRPKTYNTVDLSDVLKVSQTEIASPAQHARSDKVDKRSPKARSPAVPLYGAQSKPSPSRPQLQAQKPRTNLFSSPMRPVSATNQIVRSPKARSPAVPLHGAQPKPPPSRPQLQAQKPRTNLSSSPLRPVSATQQIVKRANGQANAPPVISGSRKKPDENDKPANGKSQHEDELTDDPLSPSYQEHLNLHSPGKHRVDFNDSSMHENERLKPSKQYPPLFAAGTPERKRNAAGTRTAEHSVPPDLHATQPSQHTQQAQQAQTGLLGRIWSAISRPNQQVHADPKIDDSSQLSFQQDDDPVFPSSLRAKLRSRYGVLADQHPWTMTHMRTIHRILNSLIAAKPDSIVPTSLALPPTLASKVGKLADSATGLQYLFKFQHACAINAFMQILVPVSLVKAMERGEVEWLGDDIAQGYRGLLGDRWGSELCFKTIHTPEGPIDREWLVQCVGCIVFANEGTRRREARERLQSSASR